MNDKNFPLKNALVRDDVISQKNIRNGFTFIELLISIVIMSIIFTVGFGNFRGFASRQKIEAVHREIMADLRLAQQQAVAGVKPIDEMTGLVVVACDSALDAQLVGYEFRYVDDTSYEFYAICTGGETLIKTVSFATKYPDVVIFVSQSAVRFNVLAQPSSDNVTITIQELDSSAVVIASRTISVTSSGQINSS